MTLTEPARGRPRDPRTHDAIMAATRRLLARDGYDQVSIDAIAKAAKVSRPTVYRRWPSKAHVVFEAAFGGRGDRTPQAPGDVETEIREFVTATVEFWNEPVVQAAALGILADRARDPELHIRTQQLLDEQTRAAFTELARRGIERGVFRPDLEIGTLYELVIGTAFYAVQVQHRTDTADLVGQLCALVLHAAKRKDMP
ncbi:MAG: TetR/AcrR family transcriptional regulator [Mycobacterium sp.]